MATHEQTLDLRLWSMTDYCHDIVTIRYTWNAKKIIWIFMSPVDVMPCRFCWHFLVPQFDLRITALFSVPLKLSASLHDHFLCYSLMFCPRTLIFTSWSKRNFVSSEYVIVFAYRNAPHFTFIWIYKHTYEWSLVHIANENTRNYNST